jgi:hypothetical protein
MSIAELKTKCDRAMFKARTVLSKSMDLSDEAFDILIFQLKIIRACLNVNDADLESEIARFVCHNKFELICRYIESSDDSFRCMLPVKRIASSSHRANTYLS